MAHVSTWTLRRARDKLTKATLTLHGNVIARGEGETERQAMADMLGQLGSLLHFAREACK